MQSCLCSNSKRILFVCFLKLCRPFYSSKLFKLQIPLPFVGLKKVFFGHIVKKVLFLLKNKMIFFNLWKIIDHTDILAPNFFGTLLFVVNRWISSSHSFWLESHWSTSHHHIFHVVVGWYPRYPVQETPLLHKIFTLSSKLAWDETT